jgi:hypothetical protein
MIRYLRSMALTLPLLLALPSCVEVRDKQENPAPAMAPTPTSPEPPPEPRLEVPLTPQSPKTTAPFIISQGSVVPLESPHQYAVHLSIPEGATGLERRLLTSEEGAAKPRHIELSPGLRTFIDVDVNEASRYAYRLTRVVNGEYQFSPELLLDVPQDFVIEAGFSIPPGSSPYVISGYERIFIKNKALFRTLGRDLTLRGKYLISENGWLETFSVGQAALVPSAAGRGGGRILFYFNKAYGRLTIYLRGEHGAPGILGGTPTDPVASGINSNYGMPFSGRCVSTPGAIAPANGLPGLPGGRGGDGGNSGSAILNIDDASDFTLDTTLDAGQAGAPGQGGPGQSGGAAGLNCYAEPGGPRGADGPQGPRGPSGRPGNNETACLMSRVPGPSCR